MEYQRNRTSADRIFRLAILNGVEPPLATRETLEARGVDTAELEARIRQSVEIRH